MLGVAGDGGSAYWGSGSGVGTGPPSPAPSSLTPPGSEEDYYYHAMQQPYVPVHAVHTVHIHQPAHVHQPVASSQFYSPPVFK